MSTPLAAGQLQFYDNDVPALTAGADVYQITASQQFSAATGGSLPVARQAFEVRAPQFSLDPAEIVSVFPPADAAGDFSGVLPHVLLTEPTLPWERTVDGAAGPPWLALLVLAQDEIVSVSVTTPQEFLAAEPGVLKPDLDLTTVPATVATAAMTCLVLPVTVFQAVVPLGTELACLTHVRAADLSGQELAGDGEDGTFGVVVAGRFPDSTAVAGTGGTRSQVHLVSLEGLGALLAGQPQSGEVAVASLYSWSFVSAVQAGGTFAELMGSLIPPAGAEPGSLLLRVPSPAPPAQPTPAQQQASGRLADGYVPLGFLAPAGEQSFAWYRGPWTPIVAPALPAKPGGHYTSADQATIYLPDSGVFDLSYAAAWTLGRTTALADRHFASALYRLRRAVHQVADLVLDRVAALGAVPGDLTPLAASNAMAQQFGTLLGAGMGDTVHAAVTGLSAGTGDSAPVVAPPGPAPGPGPLQQVQALLSQAGALDLVAAAVAPEITTVAGWLARLAMADGLPFTHLVPDSSMLPVESIRFFYTDPGWTGALIDGALSVAVESSRDVFIQQLFDPVLDAAIATALGGTPAAAGMLLRSAAVSGWPGLTVTAWADQAGVTVLRIARLSADVLLCLFAAIPDTVCLSEPAQGLRFGMQDGQLLQLRSLSGQVGAPVPGGQFPVAGDLTQFFRPVAGGAGGRVLSMSALVPALATALGLPSAASLGPADLAVQLVLAPERLQFAPGGGTASA